MYAHMRLRKSGKFEAELGGSGLGRWIALDINEGLVEGYEDVRIQVTIWEDENPEVFAKTAEWFGIDLGDKPATVGTRHVESMPA